jgi:hypothetical protein
MKIEIDLTKAKVLKAVPDGVYLLKVIDAKMGKSQKGHDKLTWHFKILKPSPVIVEESPVEDLYQDTSLVPDALFRVVELYSACGVKIKPGAFDPTDLFGKDVGAICRFEETEEYGKRNRLTFISARKTKPGLKEGGQG